MQEENKFSYRSLQPGKEKEWHYARGLDDMTTAGSYAVRLTHGDVTSLGIATGSCDYEHYMYAHLFVSESAASGKQRQVRTVGQTLLFTACTGPSVKIVTRTCELAPEGAEWQPWRASEAVAVDIPQPQELNSNAGPQDAKYVYKGSGNTDVITGGYFDKTATNIVLNFNKWGDTTGQGRDRHEIPAATETLAGLMSAADKRRLNNAETATRVEWNSGSNISDYTAGGSYIITGNRTMSDDGLPPSTPYAPFSAWLFVFGDTFSDCGCTQVLSIDAGNGGASMYTRNGKLNDTMRWSSWVDLGAATTADIQDNSITAQKLSTDVREKVNNPLRPLFIAAGAVYNDTGADKTKTAPWGETVTHKAGHYYLNGLGDITEEQMMEIYNAPHNALYEQAYAEMQNIRTLLFCGCSSSVGLNSCINALFLNCSNLEVIGNNSGFFYFSSSVSTIKNLFKRCKKLRIVAVKPFYVNNTTFDSSVFSECSSLEYIRLDRLHFSLSLADCSNITKDSVLYIIQKAIPTSAITITLHPDAYARLSNDADIVAALEAQPLISLVSA